MRIIDSLAFAGATLAGSVVNGSEPCGEAVCRSLEYCSEAVFCQACQDICHVSSHNFDDLTCKTKCAEYLNSLYIRREDLDAAVSRVYVYVAVSLVISLLVLLLVLSAFLAIWFKYQRMRCNNNNNYKKKMESIKAVCVNEVDGSKKLKLEMPVAIPITGDNHKNTPPSAMTTMTPLSTRHPSEDATLEYAYDNPTLSHSPVFGQNGPHNTPNVTPKTTRTETTF